MRYAIALLVLVVASPALALEPVPACDPALAAKREKQGDDQRAKGWYAAALHEYERALFCEPTPPRFAKAARMACTLFRATKSEPMLAKATKYIAQAPPPEQPELRHACGDLRSQPGQASRGAAAAEPASDHSHSGQRLEDE